MPPNAIDLETIVPSLPRLAPEALLKDRLKALKVKARVTKQRLEQDTTCFSCQHWYERRVGSNVQTSESRSSRLVGSFLCFNLPFVVVLVSISGLELVCCALGGAASPLTLWGAAPSLPLPPFHLFWVELLSPPPKGAGGEGTATRKEGTTTLNTEVGKHRHSNVGGGKAAATQKREGENGTTQMKAGATHHHPKKKEDSRKQHHLKGGSRREHHSNGDSSTTPKKDGTAATWREAGNAPPPSFGLVLFIPPQDGGAVVLLLWEVILFL